MFSSWDIVRPRPWHSLASLEQSMMDLDHMAEHLDSQFHHLHHHHNRHHHHHRPDENDEFFSDLPGPHQANADGQAAEQQQPDAAAAPANSNEEGNGSKRTFSTYSFSSSTVLDDKGQRVASSRRRYEDSTGRLKAVHERQIGDTTVRSVWNRAHKQDKGKHEQKLIAGAAAGEAASLDKFEEAWKQTAFGEAEDKKKQEAIKEKGEEPPASA